MLSYATTCYDGRRQYSASRSFVCLSLLILLSNTSISKGQTLSVSPSGATPVRFSGFEGGPIVAETETEWTVADSDTIGLDFTVNLNQPWLFTTPGATIIHHLRFDTRAVNAKIDGLVARHMASGQYLGTVSFVNLGDGSGNTTRDVELTIAPARFEITPAFVQFSAFESFVAQPASATVSLASIGNVDLNYRLTWLSKSWFTLNKTQGTVPSGGSDSFEVQVDPFGLSPGTYTANVFVENTTNGAGTTQIPITMIVRPHGSGSPRLTPDQDITLHHAAGFLNNFGSHSIKVENDSDGQVFWSATSDSDWISLSHQAGALAPAGDVDGHDSQILQLRPNVAANQLSAGAHVATVTFFNMSNLVPVPIGTQVVQLILDPVLSISSGLEGGTVTTSPIQTGIVPGSSIRKIYPLGQIVTLTAHPLSGYQLDGWLSDAPLFLDQLPDLGDLGSLTDLIQLPTENPIVVDMSRSRTISPVFRPLLRTLNIGVTGNGTGTLVPSPTGSFVENELVSRYVNRTVVSVAAQADDGAVFLGWTGNVPAGHSQTNPLSLMMDRDRTIAARFGIEVQFDLTIIGNGEVSSDPDMANFALGEQVTFTAIPGAGNRFDSWHGAVDSKEPIIQLVLEETNQLEAKFVNSGRPSEGEPEAGMAVGDSNLLKLTTVVVNDGIVTPSQGSFEPGKEVLLVATPGIGSRFVGWEIDADGDNLAVMIVMNQDMTVRAVFEPDPIAQRTLPGSAPCGAVGIIGWLFCVSPLFVFRRRFGVNPAVVRMPTAD